MLLNSFSRSLLPVFTFQPVYFLAILSLKPILMQHDLLLILFVFALPLLTTMPLPELNGKLLLFFLLQFYPVYLTQLYDWHLLLLVFL